jgi:NADH-quinone oxidoreductase subunit J
VCVIETVVFVVFAVAAVAGGLTMIWARNPVFSAMGLLLAMFSMAVFYILLDAHFVAAVQVIIYAGAVMTLFLFVIMLIGVDRSEDRVEQIPLQRPLTIVLAGGLFAVIAVSGRAAWVTGAVTAGDGANGTIENVADELFGTWTVPFLATVFLLTIAAVGTVALAHFGPGGLRPVGLDEEEVDD